MSPHCRMNVPFREDGFDSVQPFLETVKITPEFVTVLSQMDEPHFQGNHCPAWELLARFIDRFAMARMFA
ncbi:MAG: hypothetical protein OXB95_09255 [Rhodobacteraceae bacterium]|nr:hypothetical protein [Paracoccaceae bacterium]